MPDVNETIAKLTPAQNASLRYDQPDMFNGAKIKGRGPVVSALKRRGIVSYTGHLTEFGIQVARRLHD